MPAGIIRLVNQPCFVCDKDRLCELHHCIPQRVGGARVVPLCRSCHDAIDRMPLDKWDPAEAIEGLTQLWAALPPPARLVALKMFAIVCDAQAMLDAKQAA